MKPETTSSFDYRLEQWISKQGLFFLIANGGGSGSIMVKLIGLFFKLVLLSLVLLIFAWFFLKKRPEMSSFKADLAQQIAEGLGAKDVEVKSTVRVNGGILSGDLYIKSLKLGESESTFFEDWRVSEFEVNADGTKTDIEVVDVASFSGITVSPLNITDNYITGWNADSISINNMEISLKTGDDTDELALKSYASLFREYETLDIKSISVVDGTVYWGARETAGAIKNAQFDILKTPDTWEITVTGGTFSYAWLEDVKLSFMKVICDKSGKVSISGGRLNVGGGNVTFNVDIDIMAQPKIEGDYDIKNVAILDLVGEKYQKWLEGMLSGSGTFIGRLNSSEGITYDTTITLPLESEDVKKGNTIAIKGNEFAILEVIQTIDLSNSYSRLHVWGAKGEKGNIVIKHQDLTGISDIKLNDVRCGSGGLILMNGEFKCSESDDIPVSEEEAQFSGKYFEGSVKMGFLPKVFQNNVDLIDVLKVDQVVLRTEIDVDLQGQVNRLTSQAAKDLEDITRNRKNN